MPPVLRKYALSNNKLQIKLFGDWEKTIRVLNKLGPEIKRSSLDAQVRICNEIKDKVLGHLRNQDLHWTSLNFDYSKKKGKKGLDERTLIAYGNYYHAIESWTIGNRHIAFVGVKSGVYTKNLRGGRSKLEIAKIAVIHEFSSGRKIPRRPLWNPTISEMGGAKGLKNLYVKHLTNLLKRRGIPVKALGKIF